MQSPITTGRRTGQRPRRRVSTLVGYSPTTRVRGHRTRLPGEIPSSSWRVIVGLGWVGARVWAVPLMSGGAAGSPTSNPRSAAERLSWTRESTSSQVSGLPVSRRPVNPWTHVRIAFELVTSKNRRRARNTDFGAAASSTTRSEKSLSADLRRRQDGPNLRAADLGQGVSDSCLMPWLA